MAGAGERIGGLRAVGYFAILVMLVGSVLFFYQGTKAQVSADAASLLAFGFVILAGHAIAQLGGLLGLPRITGYLLTGMVFGPSAASLLARYELLAPFDHGVLSGVALDDLRLLDALAVGLIALTAGGELHLDHLRKGFRVVAALIVGRMLSIFVVVTVLVTAIAYLVPSLGLLGGLPPTVGGALAVGLVIASVMLSSSPAATIAVVNDSGAKGPFTQTVLAAVVLGDVPVVAAFSVVMLAASSLLGVEAGEQGLFEQLARHIVGSFAVGAIVGAGLALYLRYVGREVLLFLVALIYTTTLLVRAMHLDTILLFLAAGFVVVNFTREGDALIKHVERLSRPVYVVFFALAGAKLDLAQVAALGWVTFAVVAARALALWFGIGRAARLAGAAPFLQTHAWMGFVSQAGVSLALASIVGSRFGPAGVKIQTLIVSAIGIHELVGPVLLKYALGRSGELPDAEPEDRTNPGQAVSPPG